MHGEGGKEGGREIGREGCTLTFSETSLRMGGALEQDVAARQKQLLSIEKERG